jgi:hypothetical protein
MLGSALVREMASVPPFDRFDTVDELTERLRALTEEFPDTARARRVGTSRLGEPLQCVSVGDGPAAAVVFALPHPNEPIGGLTALHLARRLCEDADLRKRMGYTWHIVPCIDPDATRLNEGWLHGPFTLSHYGRHFYRPAGSEQVEWTFPIDYRGVYFDDAIPETVALMRLIDEVRPVFTCSLHNSEYGGAFYYVSRGTPELFATLQAIPGHVGVRLDTGEPESPDLELFDTAIYRSLSARTIIDAALANGRAADSMGSSGGSSADYGDRHGTFTLLCEVPQWTSDAADDTTPTDLAYADLLRETGADLTELGDVLDSVLDDVAEDCRTESPFLRASRFFVPAMVRAGTARSKRADDVPTDRLASVAERESCRAEVHSFRLRYAGILLRALDAEIAAGNATPAIRACHARLAPRYAAWCERAETELVAEPIEIAKLVAIQYAAILASAEHAR